MTINDDYDTHLANLAVQAATQAATGKPLSPDDIAEGLVLGRHENRAFRDLIVRGGTMTAKEFDQALQRKVVKQDLGVYPRVAADLVEAMVAQEGIGCRFDGTLRRSAAGPVRLPDGEVVELDEVRLADRQMARFANIVNDKSLRLSTLKREVRMRRDDLGLGFNDSQIDDAVDDWFEKAKRQRLFALYSDVAGPLPPVLQEEVNTQLLNIARTCFDLSEVSAEFVVAMLRKFIWQVLRKLTGIDVTDHLMLVLLGPQGVGKSTLVRQLCAPLLECMANVDFRMIADDRNIDIWSNYILFIDEMGYATKTDVDVIKNLITVDTLSRRPMRSNTFDVVRQNATFIGCSNKELSQLIRDATGIRRFLALRMLKEADWNLINSINWANVWRSVDAEAADPALPFVTMIKEQQDATRFRSPVEEWLDDFNPAKVSTELWEDGIVRAATLYGVFRAFEEEFHPGGRTSQTEWGNEMKRLEEQHGAAFHFKKLPRGRDGHRYRYVPWVPRHPAISRIARA